MKRELMNVLACPICKRDLKLIVTEENETEIVSGSRYCPKCSVHYPIMDTIPTFCHLTGVISQTARVFQGQ
jgi:uncharacterized protein YbaR (Trm112 family)